MQNLDAPPLDNSATRILVWSANGNQSYMNKDQIEYTVDGSLYIDPITRVISSNMSIYSEHFTWNTADPQIWELSFEPTQILGIWVNGIKLMVESVQWAFLPPDEIEILETLDDGDRIEIMYYHFINTP